ncbi:hypothetical protein F2P45_10520 [Massilia sp. CCM 8733]|uniref:Uncharacterized protein n=1 Tax=Massilia mucilaginosa TaxID=2609282 RepID=A0ABX0NRP0_9BURK|nr:hypothetical protein [Massilia mucilaginosa]NHZ89444.1 hypothetical protein [Massilia mucilaginosa]
MNQTPAFSMACVPRAARAALQWRLLLLWALWMLVPTLILALPAWQLLSANLDYSVHAQALARALDMTAIGDLLDLQERKQGTFIQAGALALTATLLISPMLSGMAATAARAQQAPGFAALLRGGAGYYWPMLRMLAMGALPLGLAYMIGNAASGAASAYLTTVTAAGDAALPMALAQVLMVLLMGLVAASLDAGRAFLAADPGKRSAWSAWLSGCALLARHPLAALGGYIVISIAGLVLAALLSLARANTAGVDAMEFAGALLLTQAVVVTIGWMRSARLFALVELAQADSLIKPASAPILNG